MHLRKSSILFGNCAVSKEEAAQSDEHVSRYFHAAFGFDAVEVVDVPTNWQEK